MKTNLFRNIVETRHATSLLVLLLLLTFAGCEEKQNGGNTPDEKPALTVSTASIPATAAVGNYSITVTSNVAWTAVVEDAATHAWCTITNGTKGTENGTITLHVAQNTVTEERYAIITITAGTLTQQVTVTQAATALALNVDKTTIDATAAASNHTIAVTSNVAWTVSSSATWCTVSPTSGNNNGAVTVNVAENLIMEARTATVTVTSGTLTQQVTVTQAALPAPTIILAVNKTYIDGSSISTTHSIGITSNSTWTATVSTGATWCTVSPSSGRASGSVTVRISINTLPEPRTASIIFASGPLTDAVDVMQRQSPYITTYNTSDAPSHAASNQVWAFTASTWSDDIQIPECDKADHITSNTVPDCYSQTANGASTYYYNWPYIDSYKNTLCDKGWQASPDVGDYTMGSEETGVHICHIVTGHGVSYNKPNDRWSGCEGCGLWWTAWPDEGTNDAWVFGWCSNCGNMYGCGWGAYRQRSNYLPVRCWKYSD
ncbi:MAG: BACON domain-containing protein [Prevotellaceae bacterium]|jgi:hypothetical protein|nr:BACON domain-containing protein [Prevotellaceae bacterium]